jgi:MFS family permease
MRLMLFFDGRNPRYAFPVFPMRLLQTAGIERHRSKDYRPSAASIIQGFFGSALHALAPSYLTERFPTEVRCTASAFCYHVGVVFGGLVPPAIFYLAVEQQMGFAVPMLIGTVAGAANVIVALLISPETKGTVFVSDLMKL